MPAYVNFADWFKIGVMAVVFLWAISKFTNKLGLPSTYVQGE